MDTFTAVADSTRREIIELLGSGSLDAGSIAARFDISQPAISRHLRVLREARVVEMRRAGQRRIYRLSPDGLADLEEWVDRYRTFWAGRLDNLAHLAEEEDR